MATHPKNPILCGFGAEWDYAWEEFLAKGKCWMCWGKLYNTDKVCGACVKMRNRADSNLAAIYLDSNYPTTMTFWEFKERCGH